MKYRCLFISRLTKKVFNESNVKPLDRICNCISIKHNKDCDVLIEIPIQEIHYDRLFTDYEQIPDKI
jgi:hypothetical protein